MEPGINRIHLPLTQWHDFHMRGLILAGLTLCALAGYSRADEVSIAARVVNEAQTAIAGATVSIDGESLTADAEGRFEFSAGSADPVSIIV